jgi:FG-GAP-like repeat
MRRFRFNIASVLGVILVLGVGFAALRESSDLWEHGIFTLTLAALLISILLVIHRPEKKRAFWIGFALFGWIYLGLSRVPSIESRLITTKALAYLDSKVPRSIPTGLAAFDYDSDGSIDLYVVNDSQPNLFLNKGNDTLDDVTAAAGSNRAGRQTWLSNIFVGASLKGSNGTTENFVRIGQSLLALIAAFGGGLISRYFFAKNREPDSRPVNPQA